MNSKVFIASASTPDRLAVTYAVAHRLETDYHVKPVEWNYAFLPGENTLKTLLKQTKEVDFAVFVLGPDDELRGPARTTRRRRTTGKAGSSPATT